MTTTKRDRVKPYSEGSLKAAKECLKPLLVVQLAAAHAGGKGKDHWYNKLAKKLGGPRPRDPNTGEVMDAEATLAWANSHFFNDTEVDAIASQALAALHGIGHSNLVDFVKALTGQPVAILDKMPREITAAIAEIEIENVTLTGKDKRERIQPRIKKLKLVPKTEALKLLAQAAGRLVDRKVHSGPDGGPIEHKDVSDLTPVERKQRLAAILAKEQAETGE